MATDRGANLRVRISADLADIKQGLGLLRGELAKVKADAARAAPDASAWGSSIGRIRAQLGNLAGAYVGIQTITRGVGALFSALDRADQFAKLSQSAGVSVEALSRLAYAARLSGTDVQQLSRGLGKLSQDATKNAGLLGALGIETLDAAGNTRDAAALLVELADVFAALPDGAEKSALAIQLFGARVGPGLIPLLNEGRQGLIDLGVEAEQTGSVFSTQAAQAAEQFNDNLDRLKITAQGLANETVSRLVPAFAGYAAAAAASGRESNVAADGGEALATAIKALAVPLILAKNLLEIFGNAVLLVGTAAVSTGSLIAGTLTRSVSGFSQTLLRIGAGQSPIGAIYDEIRAGSAGVADDAGAALARIRAGFSAMKDGVAEAAGDIARIGTLFAEPAAAAPKLREVGKAAGEASPRAAQLLATVRSLLGGGGAAAGASPAAKQIKTLAESTALAQDLIRRQQAALDQQFEDGAIAATEYYSRRLALQQQLIDLQVRQLESELALTSDLERRRKIEEQITILQRDRAQAATDVAREQRKALAERNAERAGELRDRASGLTGGLSAAEQSISAQMAAGTIGFVEGERRLRELRAASLQDLRALRQEQAAYVASLAPGDPNLAAATEGLLGIDTAIANITASMQELRQDTMDVGVNALTSFFGNLRDGATSAGEAFRALVADFVRGIYDMLAQATAKRLVGAIAGLFGGGGAAGGDQATVQGAVALSGAAAATTAAGTAISVGATQLSVSAAQLLAAAQALAIANSARGATGIFGLAHGGGVAGALQLSRGGIDPMVFGAAPRYHGGGIAGLSGNEIPAILQRGEVIRTRQQEAALQARVGSGQAAGAQPVRNIIVFSDAELADALSGTAGERVIVNHVRRNRGAIDG